METVVRRWIVQLRENFPALLSLLVLTVLVSLPNLHSGNIDDLDSAHHLMDGYFFRDLVHDHPHTHLAQYVYNYYDQYPALGFIFCHLSSRRFWASSAWWVGCMSLLLGHVFCFLALSLRFRFISSFGVRCLAGLRSVRPLPS